MEDFFRLSLAKPQIVAMLLAYALLGCQRTRADAGRVAPPKELIVFPAASLRDVLSDLARDYDVFLSASEDWMDLVVKAGLVAAGTRRSLLSNRLVFVSGKTTRYDAAVLAGRAYGDAAGAYLTYLEQGRARSRFEQEGFVFLPARR